MNNPGRAIAAFTFAALAAACTSQPAATSDTTPVPGGTEPAACAVAPLETNAPNATGQAPAFAGQTRACGTASNVAHAVTVVATGLAKPWSVEPLPDGSFLVSEKPGRLRHVTATGTVHPPITGLPAVDARGQGGLLDIALSPSFASDRTIYFSFTEPRPAGNGTAVGRGVLSADGMRLEQVRTILSTQPAYTNNMHYGSRLAFGPDGFLYVTMGERSDNATRPQAQQLGSHFGKILRITTEGQPAPGNPFTGQQGALPEIWSLGHRNIQAATFDAQGRLWSIEHGTRGGDELNLIRAGVNYGWPVQAYGVEYNGNPINSAAGAATTQRDGMEQPVYYWDPVIAPSGAAWYTGSAFPGWRNSLFVGGLASMRLVRLTLGTNGRVTGEEHLLVGRNKRIRDVKQGVDGNLYVVTDHDEGELWRIAPQ
jgi:aldose sugar dehydrogenase